MGERLTDDELRAAAASRPGYATYPQYRPGQPERLGRLPRVPCHPGASMALRTAPALPVSHATDPAPVVSARQPVPVLASPPIALADLPAEPVYEFPPSHCAVLPWWRRRWSWAVMASTGHVEWGYTWTLAGARRRSARAARRAGR